MTTSLKNKIAFVTGASRGIGKAIALRLAQDGAFVILQYAKNKSAAEQLLKEIKQRGSDGELVCADFNSAQAVETLFEQIDKILDIQKAKIDILINNAGIGCIQGIEEMTDAKFTELLSINVKAPFFVTQKALPRMNDGGRIVNLSSVVTRMAMPDVGAYSMTKSSLDTMTLWLAKKLGPRQITVNSVAPGIINTDMNADGLAIPQARKYMESISVFNRVGEPDDIADVVAFLASDDARWISGQRLEVSGGSFLG